MNRKSTLFLTAALLLTAALTACGDTAAETPSAGTDASAAVTEAETAETEAVYPYETEDMNGYELRIANADSYWGMYIDLDFSESDGEPLNDAVYNRNRKVEDMLNCKITEVHLDVSQDLIALNSRIKKTILAGEDLYDVTYYSAYNSPAMVTDGMFFDLAAMPELHLNEAWWDTDIVNAVKFGDSVYFTSGSLHLMVLDSAWVLFMNEKMLGQYDLTLPYDDVRAGTWTMDKLLSYEKAVANLNGDTDFKWNPDGNCIYGISLHPESPDRFLRGCDEYLVERNTDGSFSVSMDDERFQSTLDACALVLDNADGYAITASYDDFNREQGGYDYIFSVGRSLFLTAEIKTASLLRDMEDTFGVLPYPKLDETQESYNSSFCNVALFYAIPVTNTHVHETALISDVLSYESYQSVIPVYTSNRVEQKGLRNEDSIEMLNIVRDTMSVDMGVTFGWGTSALDTIRSAVMKGDSALASKLEKNRTKIEKEIQKTMDAVAEMGQN